MTLQDELWDNLDTSPMTITLADDWAREHDIPISEFRFPWDPEVKGVYYLKTYHLLHSIRKSVLNTEKELPQYSTGRYEQILHCPDAIRQDITCNVDDTSMPMTNFHNSEIGDGQPRMCRSMNKLIAWGQEPERHACYHRWSDYYPRVTNIIEMYVFCEKGSNNEKVANAYFERWGHKSPYDDGMVLGKDVMNYDDHIARNGREKEIED
ncbi:hypothetical protein B0J14DRAFT_690766 [Halenospora varia]|nr:hypothetical protein B0J14DRAFT_690766 [Halenospora varia]